MTSVPVSSSERIFILDVVRGIALCGILILNIYYFARPLEAEFDLRVYHESARGNVIAWYITHFLVEGSFRALFSMLFGAGCILLVSRLEKKDGGLRPADVYFTRITWLLIFGIINTFVILWRGDILYSYAACGLFIFPFRNSKPRVLIFMACLFMAIFIFKAHNREAGRLEMKRKGDIALALEAEKKTLTDDQKADAKKLKDDTEKRKPQSIRKESDKEIVAVQQKSYPELFTFFLEGNKEWETTIFYEVLFYDVMIFIFFGMAFFKMGILTGDKPAWLYVLFVIVGYGVGLGIGYTLGHTWRESHYNFFEFEKVNPFPFDVYQIRRLLVGLANLGVIILLHKSGIFNFLLKPFASVGQMAFSNYLGQSIICTLFFYGYGLGYFGKLERYELWYVVGAVWIFQIIFSVAWLKYFRFGPLEWVWRSLTYWKIQPISRGSQSPL